jgi:hypothetical protein
LVQRLAAPRPDLANRDDGQHGEREADSKERRTQRARRHVRNERDKSESADDERDHAKDERECRQRPRAPVDDQHPSAVVGDQESARIGHDPGLGRRAHGRQSAIGHPLRTSSAKASCRAG